jgi:spermidine/putrescine transport system permease protein
MATEATAARPAPVRAVRHPRALAFGRALLNQSLNLYAALALIYLLVPIAIIILFSFNDTQSRFNFVWQGFTLENWKDPFGVPGLTDALVNSIQIAAISTVAATVLGTMMALALVRYQFRGRGPTNLFIFLPLATPEVVLGASLLSLFLTVGFATGFTTILIAHIMFNVSFVVVTVRSRLIGFDRSLEEAAQDLGANGFQTFARVTRPASWRQRCSRSRCRLTTS